MVNRYRYSSYRSCLLVEISEMINNGKGSPKGL